MHMQYDKSGQQLLILTCHYVRIYKQRECFQTYGIKNCCFSKNRSTSNKSTCYHLFHHINNAYMYIEANNHDTVFLISYSFEHVWDRVENILL